MNKLLLVFLSIVVLLSGAAAYRFNMIIKSKETDIVEQLIEDKIALKITISEQSKIIKSQATELENLIAEHEEIFKAALEVVSENYALNKVLEDMIISMKQMFEYIQKLENQSRDRDA
ncbi:hypothetical protein LCGC14_2238990 [marine sediment metagenome]|uniref:Uncharacterized protein n=1 Tax=marine sediment metagenome TaxID=412755 RepID=A0A0F9D5R1_9ZZZZ